MKKFFSLFSVIAMTIVSFAFVGCSSSDPVAEEEEKPAPEPRYAKFEIKAIEDMFQLGDFIITIEYDNQKLTYKLDETTKVNNISFGNEIVDVFDRNPLPGRVLTIDPFEYETSPVKYTGEFVFNEEAKKRIADENEKEEIDFAIIAKLQACKKDGTPIGSWNSKDDNRGFSGVHIYGFDGFLKLLRQDNSSIFEQKL